MTATILLQIIRYLFPHCTANTLYEAAKSCDEEKLLKLVTYIELQALNSVPRFNQGPWKEPIDVEKL